jgi:hypothetical protein
MARPRTGKDNTVRSHVKTFRLDDPEIEAVEKAAAAAGLKFSELVRRAVLRESGYDLAV